MKKQNGFTLVELAIVLMIIGLLIGGILKGQELIQNARITQFARQVKSYEAAILTFKDSYGQYPGDITSPSTRIPNCTTGRCTTGGDGNGMIGPNYSPPGQIEFLSDEQNAFWLHLAAANMISGIDMNSTWTTGNYLTARIPKTPITSNFYLIHYNVGTTSMFPNGLHGYNWNVWAISPTGAISYSIPMHIIARIDRKIDDGKPWTGDMVLDSTSCGIPAGATNYDMTVTNNCGFGLMAGF